MVGPQNSGITVVLHKIVVFMLRNPENTICVFTFANYGKTHQELPMVEIGSDMGQFEDLFLERASTDVVPLCTIGKSIECTTTSI